MTRQSDWQKLLTWLSPAFPVSAFAWSAGLETAIVEGTVHDRLTTQDWITGALHHGSIKTDTILLAASYRQANNKKSLSELADFCLALTPARERLEETVITGKSFVTASKAWPALFLLELPDPCPYPIAVGAIAASHDIDLSLTTTAWLTAIVHAQVSVAVRLVPIGQSDGLAIIAALERAIAELAALCEAATLDDIGSIAYAADIAQMAHETMTTRIFRS